MSQSASSAYSTDGEMSIVAMEESTTTNNTTTIGYEKKYDRLCQNYHNAIECLKHCEQVIKSLENQLNTKDEHISSLEDRIVQMSLELASSKAAEDSLRTSMRQPPKPQLQPQQRSRRTTVDSSSQRSSFNSLGSQLEKVFHLSAELDDRPKHRVSMLDDNSTACSSHSGHQSHLSSNKQHQRRSGGRASSMDTKSGSIAMIGNQREPYTRRATAGSEDNTNNLDVSTKSGWLSGSGIDFGQLFRRNNTDSGTTSKNDYSSNEMQEDFPRDHEEDTKQGGGWNLDDSNTSLGLANLAQMMFRKSNNSNSDSVNDTEGEVVQVQGEDDNYTRQGSVGEAEQAGGQSLSQNVNSNSYVVGYTQPLTPEQQRRAPNPKRQQRQQPQNRRDSRSLFSSAVLFPVSSDDCLNGCVDRSIIKTLKGPTTASQNEEWLEFS